MPGDYDILPDEALRAVESMADAFDARSVRYALIGGLAVVLRGRLRFTQDVDFLVEVPQVVLPRLLDDLVERGFELDPTTVITQFIREHVASFLFHGVRIDWLKPVLPFYSRALADASLLEWTEGHSVRVAKPEGLVLTKMVAFRPQDQMDIETLLTANRDTVDVDPFAERKATMLNRCSRHRCRQIRRDRAPRPR